MAARFFKRKIPDHTANPNALYPDLYDNGNTSFDIQVGTVSNIKAFKFVLADMQLPDAPEFGDAKLVGAKASWYVNSIAVGELNASPALKVWKTKQKITQEKLKELKPSDNLIKTLKSNDYKYLNQFIYCLDL